jgi:hypothetical protein
LRVRRFGVEAVARRVLVCWGADARGERFEKNLWADIRFLKRKKLSGLVTIQCNDMGFLLLLLATA